MTDISDEFEAQLGAAGLSPRQYLAAARKAARAWDYDVTTLRFAADRTHKLEIEDPAGRVRRFGRVTYGDFLLYTHLEKHGRVEKGLAASKRHVFQRSHGAMSRKMKLGDPFAPNNLALRILW